MKVIPKRTLYECLHARVKGQNIYCQKGYLFYHSPGNGHVDIERLARGQRLAFRICQDCGDFEYIGPPLLPEERGWLEKEQK
jgi:hypothetical protein